MLLVTQAGITCNLAQFAYIAFKKTELPSESDSPPEETQKDTLSVLLFLPQGDAVVAASNLTAQRAWALRSAITQAWAQGVTLVTVDSLMERLGAEREGTS